MLIDPFVSNWLEELSASAEKLPPLHRVFLLIDGVFVPGLRKLLGKENISLLFESLPGCTEETKDVSPFLVEFDRGSKPLAKPLRKCDRWPMVSVIQTAESLQELSGRLSAWCVVEADGQRFNFRFADTRRLPSIFEALSPVQRAQLVGPAVSWSYISRDGRWHELGISGGGAQVVDRAVLDQQQFAMLVDDSRIDELLTLLRDRGHDPYGHPSRSHALLTVALRTSATAKIDNDDTVGWCEHFWQNDRLVDGATAALMLANWRNTNS